MKSLEKACTLRANSLPVLEYLTMLHKNPLLKFIQATSPSTSACDFQQLLHREGETRQLPSSCMFQGRQHGLQKSHCGLQCGEFAPSSSLCFSGWRKHTLPLQSEKDKESKGVVGRGRAQITLGTFTDLSQLTKPGTFCLLGPTCLLQQPRSIHIQFAAPFNDMYSSIITPGFMQDFTPQEDWDLWTCRKALLICLEVKRKQLWASG